MQKSTVSFKNGVFCNIDEVKVDLIAHQYPDIEKPNVIDGIRLASLKDIGAMKLNAIVNSGERLKDFADMYFLVEKLSLNEMLNAYETKYVNVNRSMAQNALLYHTDIVATPITYMGKSITLEEMTERFKSALLFPRLTCKMPDEPSQQRGWTNEQSLGYGYGYWQ